MSEQLKALVLSAGFGTRLKPWTDECAKPLIPVAGVEALFYALYRVQQLGIKTCFVNAHYKVEQIEKALQEFRALIPAVSTRLSFEQSILGSGGAVLKILMEEDLSGGLLALNGDTLSSFDCKKLIHPKNSTFAVSSDPVFLRRYSPLFLDSQDQWLTTDPKIAGTAVHFLGAYYLDPADLSFLKAKNPRIQEVGLFPAVFDELKKVGRAPRAVEVMETNPLPPKEFWFDLTTRDFLIEARKSLSTEHFSQWEKVLHVRHPKTPSLEALKFWPLTARDDT